MVVATPTGRTGSAESGALKSNVSVASSGIRKSNSAASFPSKQSKVSSANIRYSTKVPQLEDSVYLHPEPPVLHIMEKSPRPDRLERLPPATNPQGKTTPRAFSQGTRGVTPKGSAPKDELATAQNWVGSHGIRGGTTPLGSVRATTPIGSERLGPPWKTTPAGSIHGSCAGDEGLSEQKANKKMNDEPTKDDWSEKYAEADVQFKKAKQDHRQEQWERRQRFAEKEKAKFEVQLLKSREAVKASIGGAPMQQPVQNLGSAKQHAKSQPDLNVQHVVHEETHYVHYHVRSKGDGSMGTHVYSSNQQDQTKEGNKMRSASQLDLQHRQGAFPIDSGAATPKKHTTATSWTTMPFTPTQGPSQASTQNEWLSKLSPGRPESMVRVAGGRGKKRFS